MNRVETAVACMRSGFNCSQAILSTYGEALGLDRAMALKVAAGFGGGMGAMGEVCGAVTGAFMVIGLQAGGTSADDAQAKQRTYQLVQVMARRFKERCGSIMCRDLLGMDIDTSEKVAAAREKGLFTTVCPKLVQTAAEILEGVMGESDEGRSENVESMTKSE